MPDCCGNGQKPFTITAVRDVNFRLVHANYTRLRAGVAQWKSSIFQDWRRRFDSFRPLQFINHLVIGWVRVAA